MSTFEDDLRKLAAEFPDPPPLPPELEAELRAFVASDEWRYLVALARFQELDEDDRVD